MPAESNGAPFDLLKSVSVHPPLKEQVPRRSDVVFSTRFKRDNALSVMQAFGATRTEWVYASANEADYIKLLKGSIGWFGGTLNANVKTPSDVGVARNFDGALLVAPWMETWGTKWVTTTHPVTRKALFDWAKTYIDAGADSIQFDDPLLQFHSAYWGGGDFNQATIDGFKGYLAGYPRRAELVAAGILDPAAFDYRAYLQERRGIKNATDYLARYKSLPTTPLWTSYLRDSVKSFFADLRRFLDTATTRRIPLSMNLGGLSRPSEASLQFFLAQFADYAIAETPAADPLDLYIRSATMRALGLGFVPSVAPTDVAEGRRAIALLYALGTTPLVPWDVYVNKGPDGKPTRYFGKVEEYGDLYRFVRSNSALFDGWEAAPAVAVLVPVDKYRDRETMQLLRRLVDANVPFAFVLSEGSEPLRHVKSSDLALFRAIVTVNPPSDFSLATRQVLRDVAVPKMEAEALDDAAIRSLSPFFDGGAGKRAMLLPRASTDSARSEELVVHVVGTSPAQPGNKAQCVAGIGLRTDAIAGRVLRSATWHSPSGLPRQLEWQAKPAGAMVQVPVCEEWGIAHFRFGSQ